MDWSWLAGLGQGLQGAAKSVDEYSAQKKLSAQIALQKTQMDHMIAQDKLAKEQYDYRVRHDEDKEAGADLEKFLTNMPQDMTPVTDPARLARMKKDYPEQLIQPQSLGTSGFMGLPGQSPQIANPQEAFGGAAPVPNAQPQAPPLASQLQSSAQNFGPAQAQRFVTPGERNNIRTMEQQLSRAGLMNEIYKARIDASQGNNANNNAARYYEADMRREAADERTRRETAAKLKLEDFNKGKFAYTAALRNFKDANTAYQKENMVNIPLAMRPKMLLSMFNEALSTTGKSPYDYPEFMKAIGIDPDKEQFDLGDSGPGDMPEVVAAQRAAQTENSKTAPIEQAFPDMADRLAGNNRPQMPTPPAAPAARTMQPLPVRGANPSQIDEAHIPSPQGLSPRGEKVISRGQLRMLLQPFYGKTVIPDSDLIAYARKENYSLTR